MSSTRIGLSSTTSNRPQAMSGLKQNLKNTVAMKKTTVAAVGQENRKPSLPALSISEFEGAISSSSSPLTVDAATQDVIKIDSEAQTSVSLAPAPVRAAIPGTTLEEAEQSEEYYRQIAEAMDVALEEAVDYKLKQVKLLEMHQKSLNDSRERLDDLREIVGQDLGLDVEALENEEIDDEEYPVEIYHKIFGEEF